jgi:hypothetical protein
MGTGVGATGTGRLRVGGGRQSDVVALGGGVLRLGGGRQTDLVGLDCGVAGAGVGRLPARGLWYGFGATYSVVERALVARDRVPPKLVAPAPEGFVTGSDNPVIGVAGRIVYLQAVSPVTSSRIRSASSVTRPS